MCMTAVTRSCSSAEIFVSPWCQDHHFLNLFYALLRDAEFLISWSNWNNPWNKRYRLFCQFQFSPILLYFCAALSTTSNECVECNSFQSDTVLVLCCGNNDVNMQMWTVARWIGRGDTVTTNNIQDIAHWHSHNCTLLWSQSLMLIVTCTIHHPRS